MKASRFWITKYMQEAIGSDRGSDAYLIEGPGANELLKSAYDWATSEGHHTDWIQNPIDVFEFWEKILLGIGIDSDSCRQSLERFKRGEVTDAEFLVSATVKDKFKGTSNRHHAFFPDIDKLFYRLDIEQKQGAQVNKQLRWIWYDTGTKFNIYGAAENVESKEYLSTLGTDKFPFFCANFRCFSIERD